MAIPVVRAEFRWDTDAADRSPCPALRSVEDYYVVCGCGHTAHMNADDGLRHDCPECGATWDSARATAKDKGEGTEPWLPDRSDTHDPDAEREYDGPADFDSGAVSASESAVSSYHGKYGPGGSHSHR